MTEATQAIFYGLIVIVGLCVAVALLAICLGCVAVLGMYLFIAALGLWEMVATFARWLFRPVRRVLSKPALTEGFLIQDDYPPKVAG